MWRDLPWGIDGYSAVKESSPQKPCVGPFKQNEAVNCMLYDRLVVDWVCPQTTRDALLSVICLNTLFEITGRIFCCCLYGCCNVCVTLYNVLMTHYFAVGATSVCMTYSILFLKLWSYIQVNLWCRNRRQSMAKPHLRRQSLSFHHKSKLIIFCVDCMKNLVWIIQKRKQWFIFCMCLT